jgi:hypothetical protein
MVKIAIGLVVAAALVALAGLVGLELRYRRRPANPLKVTGQWDMNPAGPEHYRISGQVSFLNPYGGLEVMVPELEVQVSFLSKGSLKGISHTVDIVPKHPDAEARLDQFWFAYIVKSRKQTEVEVTINVFGEQIQDLQAAWVQVHYISYGPHGRVPKVHHDVIPLAFPDPEPGQSQRWRSLPEVEVLPIRTHLLGPLDTPVAMVKRYVLPQAQPGDIVSIGETPVAIMQRRLHHPSQIKPGWVATRVCQFFLPTSSLATACGMQALVDIVGPTQVLWAFAVGSIAKVFGKPGVFYQLAGEQARLIDDVTGTLPPYDQFIVLGPDNPQQVVDEIQRETGLAAAIVDVNDLQAVKILAATAGVSSQILEKALRSNPAGNADEQTPVVLIRPKG